MDVIDYNGEGRWSREAILARYAQYALELDAPTRDLSPDEQEEDGQHWIYPVMEKVIEGIETGDRACIRIGVEFIEEDAKFAFGKLLKSNTARALRRAQLTEEQCARIRRRVLGMLRVGRVPHEFQEYAKLLKRVGFPIAQLGDVPGTSERVVRFRRYLESVATRE